MPRVVVSGFLVAQNMAEADRAALALPAHIAATRAEPGCDRFEVWRSQADPLRFAVIEEFVDAAAFDFHRARTRASPWWQETLGLQRDLQVQIGDDGPAQN